MRIKQTYPRDTMTHRNMTRRNVVSVILNGGAAAVRDRTTLEVIGVVDGTA
jgi:hypothetical protein